LLLKVLIFMSCLISVSVSSRAEWESKGVELGAEQKEGLVLGKEGWEVGASWRVGVWVEDKRVNLEEEDKQGINSSIDEDKLDEEAKPDDVEEDEPNEVEEDWPDDVEEDEPEDEPFDVEEDEPEDEPFDVGEVEPEDEPEDVEEDELLDKACGEVEEEGEEE